MWTGKMLLMQTRDCRTDGDIGESCSRFVLNAILKIYHSAASFDLIANQSACTAASGFTGRFKICELLSFGIASQLGPGPYVCVVARHDGKTVLLSTGFCRSGNNAPLVTLRVGA